MQVCGQTLSIDSVNYSDIENVARLEHRRAVMQLLQCDLGRGVNSNDRFSIRPVSPLEICLTIGTRDEIGALTIESTSPSENFSFR